MKTTMKILAVAAALLMGLQASATPRGVEAGTRAWEAVKSLRAAGPAQQSELLNLLKRMNISDDTIKAISNAAIAGEAEAAKLEIVETFKKYPRVEDALAYAAENAQKQSVALRSLKAASDRFATATEKAAAKLGTDLEAVINWSKVKERFIEESEQRIARLRQVDANLASDAAAALEEIKASNDTFVTIGRQAHLCATDDKNWTDAAFLRFVEMHAAAANSGTYRAAVERMTSYLKGEGLDTASLSAQQRVCLLGHAQEQGVYEELECHMNNRAVLVGSGLCAAQ